MARTPLLAFFVALALEASFLPQSKTTPPQQNAGKSAQPPPEEDNPPEEDASVAPKVYPFNPLESDRNIKVGNFYMRQGTARGYRAALGRFQDATRYNPNSAEAFFRLGEAEEKLKNKDGARAAFEKVMRLAPDSKLAHEARKKLGSKS